MKNYIRPLLGRGLWCALSVGQYLGFAVDAQQTKEAAQRGHERLELRLRIDANLAQSLARTGCAVHAHSNSAIPFSNILSLPPGPYKKVYGTKSGTRYFGIVGDDCDYVGNPAAPTPRMVSLHRMDSGLIYVALFNARGDVLALLDETRGSPPQYERAKVPEIEAIYADLTSETQSWNTALLKLLQNRTQ